MTEITCHDCYGCEHPHGCTAPDEPCYRHCESCAEEIRACGDEMAADEADDRAVEALDALIVAAARAWLADAYVAMHKAPEGFNMTNLACAEIATAGAELRQTLGRGCKASDVFAFLDRLRASCEKLTAVLDANPTP